MDWLEAVFANAPAIIAAASKSSFGIVALACLLAAVATIFYLARTPQTSPWLGFAAFVLLIVGTLGLSVVALYVGAGRAVDLAEASVIEFKTPYLNTATGHYRLLDATITRVDGTIWRELQERPDGNAEYRHVVKVIEPGRILFVRAPNANGEMTDKTELAVDTVMRELCYRSNGEEPNWECPYALAGIH